VKVDAELEQRWKPHITLLVGIASVQVPEDVVMLCHDVQYFRLDEHRAHKLFPHHRLLLGVGPWVLPALALKEAPRQLSAELSCCSLLQLLETRRHRAHHARSSPAKAKALPSAASVNTLFLLFKIRVNQVLRQPTFLDDERGQSHPRDRK
jgi:hypothetical protein